jgi:acid-sensing ion channel, other
VASYDDNYYQFIPLLAILPNLTYDNFGTAYELYKEALAIDPGVEKILQRLSLREMAFKLAMKCEDLLSVCSFRGDPIHCCDYFDTIYSEHGFCFSFNPRFIGSPDDE